MPSSRRKVCTNSNGGLKANRPTGFIRTKERTDVGIGPYRFCINFCKKRTADDRTYGVFLIYSLLSILYYLLSKKIH